MSRTVSHTHNLELLSLGLQDCLVSPKADKRKYLLSCQEFLYSVSTNFCKWQSWYQNVLAFQNTTVAYFLAQN